MFTDLDATERANRAALLLAHDRYTAQLAPFVKGQAARLSYVETQIGGILEQCAEETGADLDWVKERFGNFLRDSVKQKLSPDGYQIKNESPDVSEFEATDIADRGEVPGKGADEARDEGVEKVDLSQYSQKFACVRCGQREKYGKNDVCAPCATAIARQAARSDYDHWNEDADRMWWEEEGKHPNEPEYDPEEEDRLHGDEDAAWEQLQDWMWDLPHEELQQIAAGTYVGHLPVQGLDPDGVKDTAANVLLEMGKNTDVPDPYLGDPNSWSAEQFEQSERNHPEGPRRGKTADQEEGDGDFIGQTGLNGSGAEYTEPGNGPIQQVNPNEPFVCPICKRQSVQVGQAGEDEIQNHINTDHADVLQRQRQFGEQNTVQQPGSAQPGQIAPAFGAKTADGEDVPGQEDPAKVEPLTQTPGDQFQSIVDDLAMRAAARHFSLPDETQIHSIASQLGLPVDEVRNSLVTIATFGNFIGQNGELGGTGDPPDGYEAVQVQSNGGDQHSALVPTDLVVSKVAEDQNIETDLAYSMIRDKYGADLPVSYHASVQGQQLFYLPTQMAGNQDQQQQVPQPPQTDPNVGPAFQQTPPGAPVPQPVAPQQQ